MKIIPVDLPEAYLKMLKESITGNCLYIPEHIRIEVREKLRRELGLIKEREVELEDKNNF